MPKASLRLLPLAISPLCALLFACGGAGGAEPMGCGAGPDCAATGRCLGGSCVEDLAPVAAFTIPADLRTLALAAFDASASSDPDTGLGDEVVGYAWSITSAGAPCDPPAVAGSARTAQVRFSCAGHYAAALVVTDALGKVSAPSAQEFDVAEGSSLVDLGADQPVDHRCAGNPVVCTTDGGDPVVVATVSVEPLGALHYTWTALAPSGPLGDERRVTFPSSPAANSTRVHIETGPGTLIKDDWPIQVTVSDDAGPLGTATTRINVGNRAPAATTVLAVSVNHSYGAGAYRATAAGAQFTDPDGDALIPAATGSTACPSFTLAADGTAQLACQKAFSGALGLSGFVATHAVSQRVTDPWGLASPTRSTSVTILNRATTAQSSTDYYVRSCATGSCCRNDPEPPTECVAWRETCPAAAATGTPGVVDPDGDPVLLTWVSGSLGTGSAVCAPGACVGSSSLAAANQCGDPPPGSATGTFTASDGLTTSDQATLTLTW